MGNRLKLVLDSGATTCRYLLYEYPDNPVAGGTVKGLNYTEEGDWGVKALFDRLSDELSSYSCPGVIGLALAGSGRKDINRRLRAGFHSCLPEGWGEEGVLLFHDGEAALWSVFGSRPGLVVTAGTGSIALGRDSSGRFIRAGGWGRLAGDEGSGYWIGQRAVQLALRSFDGRERETALTRLLPAAAELDGPEELVAWIHDSGRTKDEVAVFAVIVAKAADEGDLLCRELLKEAAGELFVLTRAVIRRGKYPETFSIGITGSVFLNNKTVFDCYCDLMFREFPGVKIQKPRCDNLEGAVKFTEHLITEGRRTGEDSYFL